MPDVVIEMARTVASRTRLGILQSLGEGRSVSEIVELTGVSRPAVSYHLGRLLQVGLVRVRRSGRRRIYGLGPRRLYLGLQDEAAKQLKFRLNGPASEGSDHTLLHIRPNVPYFPGVRTHFDPFGDHGPEEVPLERAPLVRVVAQLRFPPIVSLAKADFIAPFQEALRGRYPILRPEQTTGFLFTFGPMSGMQQNTGVVWRFHDKTDGWRVSLSSDFVALDATTYKDRDDFFERFEQVLVALEDLTRVPVYERLGVRYINRVRGSELEKLGSMVRPEVLGIASTPIAGLGHSLCESLFQKDDTALNTRWGRLPPNLTTDPVSIEPIPEPSWILDLDMFRQVQKDFDTKSILDDGRMFARTIHDFFRWCVKDEFLKAYGGKP